MRTTILTTALLCAAASGAFAADVKFTPVETYTVVYNVSGLQTGTMTQYSRKFGTEQAQFVEIKAAGKTSHMRVLTKGATIITYAPDTKVASSTNNPGYAALSKVAAGKTGNGLSPALLQSLTFVPNGKRETIAGETCMNWNSKTLKQTRCVTEDGIALKIVSEVGTRSLTQVATSVTRGSAGPADAYDVPKTVTIKPVKTLGGTN